MNKDFTEVITAICAYFALNFICSDTQCSIASPSIDSIRGTFFKPTKTVSEVLQMDILISYSSESYSVNIYLFCHYLRAL